MEVRLLRHYVAVVEHGSMLRASQSMLVTQPAISKSIKTLESELEVRLLDRLPTGVAPTRVGLRLFGHAKLILSQIDRAEAEVKGGSTDQWSHIRIGFGLNFAGSILAEAVFDVLKGHPRFSATVTSRTFDELIPLLKRGDLDLAVAAFPFNRPHLDLTYETLAEDEFRVVCAKNHPLVGRGQQSPKALAGETWVLFDRPELLTSLFNSIFLDEGLAVPSPAIQTNSNYIVKSAIKERDCLAYLPLFIVFEELRNGEFVILPTSMPRKKTRAGIIYRTNDIMPAPVQEIIGILRNSRDELRAINTY